MRARLALVVAVAACGGSLGGGAADDGTDADAAIPDALIEPGWTSLIQRNWSLQTHVEDYLCKRIKITQDTYISGFKPLAPAGTHHEILTISTSPGIVGDYDCDPSNNEMQMLFAGGSGTDEMMFPQGVAIKLAAGTYINLNLHAFNLSDDTLSGTSGILVKTMAAADVVNEADMVFLGTFDIHIPPTSTMSVELGSCSIPAEWTVFNLWPHMHGYAKNQKVDLRRNSESTFNTVVLDHTYDYLEQRNYPMTPIKLNVNDELRVTCSYINNTNITQPPGYEITYGESATAEMCFTGMYKYPKGGSLYQCAQL
jgi:hypothetical protein